MREIKFRAWNTYGSFYQKNLVEEMAYFKLTDLDEEYIIPFGTYLHEDCNLMQYTGLKDKNDKEIYEGDIVKISWQEGENKGKRYAKSIKHEVKFHQTGYGNVFENPDSYYKIEVRGNIYENPELVEENNADKR